MLRLHGCSPAELHDKLLRGDDFVLLDVRNAEELELARVKGCLHIPLNELENRIGELESCRHKEIVVMCHHGVRSSMAQGILTEWGFPAVRNLVGGIDAYAATVDPRVGFY